MKKTFYILIFFLLSCNLDAQTWPMPGAIWEYSEAGTGNLRDFAYTKDTVINSTNYQVIEHTNSNTYWPYNLGSVYTRYSNDTVYRYVQSKEYPFLIFTAQINDIYTTFRPNFFAFGDSACNSSIPVKVLQLDTITLGTLTLKKWLLQDTLFDDLYGPNSPSSTWRVVERIGFLNDFPFTPNISILDHQCYIPTETVEGYNLCYYSDNTYSYSVPCAVGINKKIKDNKVTIYPSPANDVLNISIPDLNTSIEIIVTNIMGEIVNHRFLLKENLSLLVANLPVGFYFLSCSTPQYNITTPFIINR